LSICTSWMENQICFLYVASIYSKDISRKRRYVNSFPCGGERARERERERERERTSVRIGRKRKRERER